MDHFQMNSKPSVNFNLDSKSSQQKCDVQTTHAPLTQSSLHINHSQKSHIQPDMSVLHARLASETERLNTWKIDTEMQMQEKMRTIQELKDIINKQKKNIFTLQMESEKLSAQLERELDAKSTMMTKMTHSKHIARLLQDQFQAIQSTIEETKSDIDMLKQQRGEHIKAFQDLEKRFKNLEQLSSTRANELQQSLDKEVQEHEKTKAVAQHHIDELTSKVQHFKKCLSCEEHKASELEEKLKASSDAVQLLMKQREETEKKLKEAKETMQSFQEKVAQEAKVLHENIFETRRALIREKERVTELDTKEQELKVKIERLTLTRNMLETEKDEMLATNKKVNAEKKQLTEEVSLLEKSLASMKMMNADLESEKSELKDTLVNIRETSKQELENSYNKCKQTEEELEKCREEIKTKDELLSVLETIIEEKEQALTKVKQLESLLLESATKYDSLLSERDATDTELKNVMSQFNQISSEHKDLSEENEDLKKKVEDFNQKAINELSVKETLQAELNVTMSELEEERKNAKAESDLLKERIKTALEDLNEMRIKNDESDNLIKELNEQLKFLTDQIAATEKLQTELNGHAANETEKLKASWEECMKSKDQEIGMLSKVNEELKVEKGDVMVQKNNLEEKLSMLNSKLQNVTKEKEEALASVSNLKQEIKNLVYHTESFKNEMDRSIADKQENITKLQYNESVLNGQLNESSLECSELRKFLRESQYEKELLQGEISGLKAQLEEHDKEKEQLKANLEQQVEKLSHIKDSRSASEDNDTQLTEMKAPQPKTTVKPKPPESNSNSSSSAQKMPKEKEQSKPQPQPQPRSIYSESDDDSDLPIELRYPLVARHVPLIKQKRVSFMDPVSSGSDSSVVFEEDDGKGKFDTLASASSTSGAPRNQKRMTAEKGPQKRLLANVSHNSDGLKKPRPLLKSAFGNAKTYGGQRKPGRFFVSGSKWS